jgi:Putative DNA-binding domain
MKLAELQRGLSAYIKSDGATLLDGVAEQSKRGLPVYHYAYRASLINALRDVFERTHSWLGDDFFDGAARAHIEKNPPNSWTMSDYGLGFEEVLTDLHPGNPEVAELAWLDWNLRVAFNGQDCPALDRAKLAETDWDNAQLHITPTLTMRPITTNVGALWGALEDEEADPPKAHLLDAPEILTVWRQDLAPRFQCVSELEGQALALAIAGASFGGICSELGSDADNEAEFAAFAGAMLGRWISDDVLIDVGS